MPRNAWGLEPWPTYSENFNKQRNSRKWTQINVNRLRQTYRKSGKNAEFNLRLFALIRGQLLCDRTIKS